MVIQIAFLLVEFYVSVLYLIVSYNIQMDFLDLIISVVLFATAVFAQVPTTTEQQRNVLKDPNAVHDQA